MLQDEVDTIGLLATGLSQQQVAHQLGISVPMIDVSLISLRQRFGAKNTVELASKLILNGTIDIRYKEGDLTYYRKVLWEGFDATGTY